MHIFKLPIHVGFIMIILDYHIGLYRENAIAIESEARDPFGGNVYYVTKQITFPIPEFARKERNLHCDIVHDYTLPPNGSLDSFWITRSQQSRRRDKGLYCHNFSAF